MAHRVTVNGRIIEWRQAQRRFQLNSGHAAARTLQGHKFGFGDRRNTLCDQPIHVLKQQKRPGKRKAVISQLRHYRPRVATTSATGTACLIKKSPISSTLFRSMTGIFTPGKATSVARPTTCGSWG